MATHSSILTWRIPSTKEPGGYGPWDRKESDTIERQFLSLSFDRWDWVIHVLHFCLALLEHLLLEHSCHTVGKPMGIPHKEEPQSWPSSYLTARINLPVMRGTHPEHGCSQHQWANPNNVEWSSDNMPPSCQAFLLRWILVRRRFLIH